MLELFLPLLEPLLFVFLPHLDGIVPQRDRIVVLFSKIGRCLPAANLECMLIFSELEALPSFLSPSLI